jgi:hypothetical protein
MDTSKFFVGDNSNKKEQHKKTNGIFAMELIFKTT